MCAQPIRSRVRSYAKINTRLHVGARRADGYHDLCTVFQSIALHDLISFETIDEEIRMRIHGADLPADAHNLVHRAAVEFRARSGIRSGWSIELEKRIPLAAGLGGGSSNAASTLIALNRMSGLPLNADELHDIAAGLGSDVPYFLLGGRALGSGRGEILEPLDDLPERHLLLLIPPFGIKSSQAYQDFDLTLQGTIEGSKLSECRQRYLGEEHARWHNDLERGVFVRHPELDSIKKRLLQLGADDALMSGSGSVIVGGFGSRERAEEVRDKITDNGFDIILTKTISRAEFRRGYSPDIDEA